MFQITYMVNELVLASYEILHSRYLKERGLLIIRKIIGRIEYVVAKWIYL